jgi:hypothetical protein
MEDYAVLINVFINDKYILIEFSNGFFVVDILLTVHLNIFILISTNLMH